MAIKKISHLRNSYEKGALLEKDVSEDPFVQFKKWFNLHLKSDVVEPTAMTLATASKTGRNIPTYFFYLPLNPDLPFCRGPIKQ